MTLRAAAVSLMLGAALSTVLVAVLVAAPPTSERDTRAELRALIDRLGSRERYDAPSPQRELSGVRAEVPRTTRPLPMPGDPAAARLETLAGRAQWRAYDGAPPVMPHSRNFVARKTCLDCHAEGIWLGQRFGSPLSHPELTNCTQCHVESSNLVFPEAAERLDNGFAGRLASGRGERAWTLAPPVMPHATMMRSRCLSCHGPQSYPGLRTDHPERMNCTQCHAVAASLDQSSPFFTGNATLLVEPAAEPDP